MRKMSEVIEKTWEQEIWEQAHTQGQLQEARTMLRSLLEEQLGPLPEALIQQIESIDDLARLRAGLKRVLSAATLDEFKL
jgi:hypothetical protein